MLNLPLSHEQKRFLRFCMVGVANTLLHMAVVYTLVEAVGMLPELGNTTGSKVSALLGVAPFDHDSGKEHGRRRICG